MSTKVNIPASRLPGNGDIPLPAYQTIGAAGMDLVAAVVQPVVLPPGKVVSIPCGLMLGIPLGFEGQIRPRSGLALKHAVTVANSPGTIDSDYRGEIKVLLVNLGSEDFPITRGMRIAQLVIAPVVQSQLMEVQSLPPTDRGTGGFGHTGQ